MVAKTPMRIIIIPMLLFLFLSTTMVIADLSYVGPRDEKKSLSPRAIIVHKKIRGLPSSPPPKRRGPVPSAALFPFADP